MLSHPKGLFPHSSNLHHAISNTSDKSSSPWFFCYYYYYDASCHYKSVAPTTIEIADRCPLVATKISTIVRTNLPHQFLHSAFPLFYIVPQLSMNWPSISQLNVARYHVTFTDTHHPIQDLLTGKQMGRGRRLKGPYHLEQLHLICFIQLAAPIFSDIRSFPLAF